MINMFNNNIFRKYNFGQNNTSVFHNHEMIIY